MSDNVDFGRRGFLAFGLSTVLGWRDTSRAASRVVADAAGNSAQ